MTNPSGPRGINFDDLEFRIQGSHWGSGRGASANWVPYLKAHRVAEILDQWVGPFGWKDSYEEVIWNRAAALRCYLSVQNEDGEWVTKEDVGTYSDMEATKGGCSDAFKRVASRKWGVGRQVYDLGGAIPAPCEVYTTSRGKEQAKANAQTLPAIQAELSRRGITWGGAIDVGNSDIDDPTEPEPGQEPRQAGWWDQAGWESEEAHAEARTGLLGSLKLIPQHGRESVRTRLRAMPTGLGANIFVMRADGKLAARLSASAVASAMDVAAFAVADSVPTEAADDEAPDEEGGAWWSIAGWPSEDAARDAQAGYVETMRGLAEENAVASGLARTRLAEMAGVDGCQLWEPSSEDHPAGRGRPGGVISPADLEVISDIIREARRESGKATGGNRRSPEMKRLEAALSALSIRSHDSAMAALGEEGLLPVSQLTDDGVAIALDVLAKFSEGQGS